MYLIRWEGYQSGDDTWEPEVSLGEDVIIAIDLSDHLKFFRATAMHQNWLPTIGRECQLISNLERCKKQQKS